MSDILQNYTQFVEEVTSKDSNDGNAWIDRVIQLNTQADLEGWNLPLLVTGAVGMAAEAGEFADIVKKVLFHGKPLDDDNFRKLELELGDVMWYWTNSCRALGVDPVKIIQDNVTKLEARYPGGKFDVMRSENRAKDDI
jgi:NTP pyrophosphatase (non-canonical NTP hydrolase)